MQTWLQSLPAQGSKQHFAAMVKLIQGLTPLKTACSLPPLPHYPLSLRTRCTAWPLNQDQGREKSLQPECLEATTFCFRQKESPVGPRKADVISDLCTGSREWKEILISSTVTESGKTELKPTARKLQSEVPRLPEQTHHCSTTATYQL